MAKLKVRKKIIYTILAFLVIVLLWGDYLSGFALLSRIQYNNITSNMNSVEARVVNITGEHSKSSRGRIVRWIHITYEVDGVIYSQEPRMIVRRLFNTQEDLYYSVGDKLIIFYNPNNPNEIAYPNSAEREMTYEFICLGAIVLVGGIEFIFNKCQSSSKMKKQKQNEVN